MVLLEFLKPKICQQMLNKKEQRSVRFRILLRRLASGGSSIMEFRIMRVTCCGTLWKMLLKRLAYLRNLWMTTFCNWGLEKNLGLIFRNIKTIRSEFWGLTSKKRSLKLRMTREERFLQKIQMRTWMIAMTELVGFNMNKWWSWIMFYMSRIYNNQFKITVNSNISQCTTSTQEFNLKAFFSIRIDLHLVTKANLPCWLTGDNPTLYYSVVHMIIGRTR